MKTPEQAKAICSERCAALCCHGPATVMLTSEEVERLSRLVGAGGIAFEAKRTFLDNGFYMELKAEGCVFLGSDNLCQIYEDRPQGCRTFPLMANTPRCELSGWVRPPKIFVGVPRSGERMNLSFETAFLNMQSYLKKNEMWGGAFEAISAAVEDNQNDIVEHFLESKADYLFFVEDDMVFQPNTPAMMVWKMKKAQQQGIDMRILGGLYFQRNPAEPSPHFYKRVGVKEVRGERAIMHEALISEVAQLMDTLPIPEGNGPYVLGPEHPSILKIDTATTGLLVVERSVFEQVPYPWFRRMGAEVGEPGFTAVDLAFFYRASQVGIDTYGDVGVMAGHLNQRPIGVKSFREWRELVTAKENGYAQART